MATSMTLEDIHVTLVEHNMISILDSAHAPKPLPGQTIKFPKGRKNGIARKHLQRTQTHNDEKVKGPFVPPTRYKVRWDADQVDDYMARWEAKGYFTLKPDKLKWSPFILSRAQKTQSSEGVAVLGQGNGDNTRGVSADIPSSEANETTANDFDVSSETQALVEDSRSPAFALFDDDNVEIVRASASRKSTRTELADATANHRRSPSVELVQSTRPKRNKARDLSGPPSIRRLRSRDSVNESTPVRRRIHTPRQDSAPQSERRRSQLRSRRVDVSVSPTSNGRGLSTPSMDDDAALAARLAMEDNPRRQLRTRRPSADQQLPTPKRLVSASRSSSPRKRRRVDSSPEVEMVPSPISSVIRRSSRSSRHGESPLSQVTSTPSRRSSRRTVGRSATRSVITALPEQDEEEDTELAQLPQSDAVEMDDNADGDAYVEADDSRYEDADTPVTGATLASRHSVPSDDTMIGGDVARRKTSPMPMALDPLSVLAQVAGEIAEANAEREEVGGDEDAEGEDDVDAEGELDDDMDL